MKVRFTLLLASFWVLSSCAARKSPDRASPTPTPKSPAQRVAESEAEFQEDSADSDLRAEARQAVTDFIKSKAPSWKIKGCSSEAYQNSSFWVAVDLEKDKRIAIAPFLVRKFFPESGDPYWRVIFLRSTFEEQQHALHDADLLKQLNQEKERVQELENPEPIYQEPPDEP